MRWSVGVQAESELVLTREQVVELADAVAGHEGIATGIGSTRLGAQLVVEAGTRAGAEAEATALFTAALETAGLPIAPIIRVEAISEDEDALP